VIFLGLLHWLVGFGLLGGALNEMTDDDGDDDD
jgi:hypothetical protein